MVRFRYNGFRHLTKPFIYNRKVEDPNRDSVNVLNYCSETGTYPGTVFSLVPSSSLQYFEQKYHSFDRETLSYQRMAFFTQLYLLGHLQGSNDGSCG